MFFHSGQSVYSKSYYILYIYIAGEISIEHVTIFKGAVDLEFSPDVGNNPSNPYIQRK